MPDACAPLDVLTIATLNGARFLGRERDLGSIEPGKLADLVLVEGNPLEDIGAAHKVRRVFANGRGFELKDLLEGRPPGPPKP